MKYHLGEVIRDKDGDDVTVVAIKATWEGYMYKVVTEVGTYKWLTEDDIICVGS